MENSFWFVLIGGTVYGLHRLWKHKISVYLGLLDVLSGAGIGIMLGQLMPVHIGYDILPLWFTATAGGLSAIILWLSERWRLFEKHTVQYSLMILMSLLHAGLLFILYKNTLLPKIPDYLPPPGHLRIFIQILLVSAVSLVGFTFPKRAFRVSAQKI